MNHPKKIIFFALLLFNSFVIANGQGLTKPSIDPFIKNRNLDLKKNFDFELKVSFSNINIGKLKYSIKKNNEEIFTKATLKTNSFYDFIFKIRDEITSSFSIKTLLPTEFNFNKKEGKKESYVKMVFKNGNIHFSEKWKKKKKTGKKEKTYSSEGKSFFDLCTMLNYAIFSKGELNRGDYFWLALKSNFYKVVLKTKQNIKVKYKKKKVNAFKYKFSSFKGEKEEKKGDFSIVVLHGDNPVFYELEGHLKIGKIKGLIKHAN
tara:strand:- start:1695 stop:2480 length:786 start_codon:yes stop_codon:yes gene_type:complete